MDPMIGMWIGGALFGIGVTMLVYAVYNLWRR